MSLLRASLSSLYCACLFFAASAHAAVLTSSGVSGTLQAGTGPTVSVTTLPTNLTEATFESYNAIGAGAYVDDLDENGAYFGQSLTGTGQHFGDITTTVTQTLTNDTGSLVHYYWDYEILPGEVLFAPSVSGLANLTAELVWSIAINGIEVAMGGITVGTGASPSVTGDALLLQGLSQGSNSVSWAKTKGAVDLGLFDATTIAIIEYRVNTRVSGDLACGATQICGDTTARFIDPPGAKNVIVMRPAPADDPLRPDFTEITLLSDFDAAANPPPPVTVPLPSTLLLLVTGLSGLVLIRRRRSR